MCHTLQEDELGRRRAVSAFYFGKKTAKNIKNVTVNRYKVNLRLAVFLLCFVSQMGAKSVSIARAGKFRREKLVLIFGVD